MDSNYINTNSNGERVPVTGKAAFLIRDGARKVTFEEFSTSPLAGLVVVVENGSFDAALHCENEYNRGRVLHSIKNGDSRPVTFFILRARRKGGRAYLAVAGHSKIDSRFLHSHI